MNGISLLGASVVLLSASLVAAEAAACAPQSPLPRHAHVRQARARRPATAAVPPVAPGPPAAPAAAASLETYNVDRINALRRAAGVPPVVLDATLTTFAREGTAQLMRDHVPHGHFAQAGDTLWKRGFHNGAAENQGAPTGWPRASADADDNARRQIDDILGSMMREGPGGGHHDNILNAKMRRIGVGLAEDADGKLYLTNDFSG